VKRCDLVAIVREAVADQRMFWPARRITYAPAEDLEAPVLANARHFGQVVTNHLTNALKYTPGDWPVEIWLGVGGAEARICVRGEGPGLPAAA
jgi:two-component system sensor histidine kinase KdpD